MVLTTGGVFDIEAANLLPGVHRRELSIQTSMQ